MSKYFIIFIILIFHFTKQDSLFDYDSDDFYCNGRIYSDNKGLSQRQLANAIGISNAEISKIESGEREIPNPKLFRKISKVIGLNYNDMMEMVGLGGKLTPLNPFIKKHYENLKGEELDYEWMLFRSSVKRNDDMIDSLNEELASNKLSEEEKDSALETIQDLEYQNVTNKLILGILDENRLKEAKKNAKNKDVFK